MKWSNELPKVPGWYFVKSPDGINRGIKWIGEALGKSLYFFHAANEIKYPENKGWQFSGPIPEPED